MKKTLAKFIYWLGFTTITTLLSFCTPKRTVRLVGNHNGFLEKTGKYCNLFYKKKDATFVLIADSVTQVVVYDSVLAYARVKLSTYPDMTIVKVGKGETIVKTHVDGLSFSKVFPTFFSFAPSIRIHHAGELYDFMEQQEVEIDGKNVISL